jgi:mRNA interferase RelE/StbE
MVRYESSVLKQIEKRSIPTQVLRTMHTALNVLDQTRDLGLFDVKEMRGSFKRTYYRLRKGKFRAIFFLTMQGLRLYTWENGRRSTGYGSEVSPVQFG